MINEQKKLLADVKAATADALKLYNAGVKIGGVVQRLRAVEKELETRVRYLERPVSTQPGRPAVRAPRTRQSANQPARTTPAKNEGEGDTK